MNHSGIVQRKLFPVYKHNNRGTSVKEKGFFRRLLVRFIKQYTIEIDFFSSGYFFKEVRVAVP
jgi:hypothetical protein